jgi:hypothetical protein
MKTLSIIILSLFIICGCDSPAAKKVAQKLEKQKTETARDSANPKTSVTVNKKFDDKGNLLRYDSTYSYHYSTPFGNRSIGADTLYRHFKSWYLGSSYDSLFNRRLGDLFFNDTLFKYDFLQPDYFSKRFELNQSYLQNMLRQMDSLKSDYLNRDFPQGQIKKNRLDK